MLGTNGGILSGRSEYASEERPANMDLRAEGVSEEVCNGRGMTSLRGS